MLEVNTRTTDGETKFWLVWTKNGLNPRRSHTTRDAAEAEAARLAERHPSRRWFVVEAVSRFWINEAEDRAAAPEAVES